jgi:hypothetical protein
MAKGGLLFMLVTAAFTLAAMVFLYLVIRALWAEIGPMVRLLLHRDRVVALGEDQDVGLKH